MGSFKPPLKIRGLEKCQRTQRNTSRRSGTGKAPRTPALKQGPFAVPWRLQAWARPPLPQRCFLARIRSTTTSEVPVFSPSVDVESAWDPVKERAKKQEWHEEQLRSTMGARRQRRPKLGRVSYLALHRHSHLDILPQSKLPGCVFRRSFSDDKTSGPCDVSTPRLTHHLVHLRAAKHGVARNQRAGVVLWGLSPCWVHLAVWADLILDAAFEGACLRVVGSVPDPTLLM
mmetsp:Transcript_96707/g.211480  ORF Transcript_96707/g.211480 Transcript_96707/m.211480 type:complete len:230 (-) Transcript_96707:721-1410(-)